ncbi:MAG: FAD-binding oxidoreductase, partial [Acidobacteriota bacterium]|nr:FAD-binding oxidoreductase [Acidobacteriota bacterium]
MFTEVRSWARYPASRSVVIPLRRGEEAQPFERGDLRERGISMLAHGMGRSLGDSCLNDENALLMTRGLDRIVSFDDETGRLVGEAGVTFDEILRFAMPRGWFLPVTPGTRFVSLGGAVANDVHGKN